MGNFEVFHWNISLSFKPLIFMKNVIICIDYRYIKKIKLCKKKWQTYIYIYIYDVVYYYYAKNGSFFLFFTTRKSLHCFSELLLP